MMSCSLEYSLVISHKSKMAKQNLNDISLIDLFLMETAQQCLTLNQQIAMLTGNNRGQTKSEIQTCKTQIDYNALHRSLHSIKGAARIIDLQPVVDLTQSLEDILRSIPDSEESKIPWQTIIAGIDQLNKISTLKADQLRSTVKETQNIIRNISCSLDQNTPLKEDNTGEEINMAGDNAPKPTTNDISHDLFEIFKEDAKGHLATLSGNIIQLEKTPNDAFLLEESMRAAHSIKGAARIIELHEIVQISHLMEDILLSIQGGSHSLSPQTIDNLLAGCDLLEELTKINISQLENWFSQNSSQIRNIEDLLASSTADKIKNTATGEDIPATHHLEARKSYPTAQDRTIRVSAKNMNRLMGLAGEAIVEAEWLPLLMKKTLRIKNKQDEIWAEINNIHKHLIEMGIPAYLEDSFAYLNHRIKYCQEFIGSYISEIDDHARNSTNISHRLQHEIITNQMQPFSEGIKGLPRLIRDMSRQQNKQINLVIEGADTQIDRDIMKKLEAPLTHIITNAIDHGVEAPEARIKSGKPPEATIKIMARHASGQLYITISDDGGGVDFNLLRKKIISQELVSPKIAADLSESELLEFLFLPNFTTKSTISESSGRGVGLDVVHNIIRQVRGSIEVSSETGHGSYFELRLPLTLSIIRSIVVEINDEPYAFPLVNIDHIVHLDKDDLKEMEGRQYIISHNKRIGIISAQQVLELTDRQNDENHLSIVVLENANTPYGLIVDHLHGIRDLVVQPLTPKLGKLRSISAASIAEDGTPILILDVQDLIISMDHLISGNRLQHIEVNLPSHPSRSYKRILVVDDSITVREVERSLLVKHGFEVDVAADGIAAWNLIKEEKYSLIITDIDMPQMDGIELLCQIRESQDFAGIPVIIVSYKDREEDKNRGLEAGADYYLTKGSFTDRSLIEAVEDLIGYPEKTP